MTAASTDLPEALSREVARVAGLHERYKAVEAPRIIAGPAIALMDQALERAHRRQARAIS